MRIAINTLLLSVPDTGSGQYIAHLLQALAARDDAHTGDNEYVLLAETPLSPLGRGGGGEGRSHAEGYTPHPGPLPVGEREDGGEGRFRPIALRSPLHKYHAGLDKVWWEQVSFPRACARVGADVAHMPYFASALWPRVPTVVTVLDLIPLILPEYRASALVRLYTALAARSVRRAIRIIAISEWSKRDVVRLLRVPADRVHVIYLAADERFRPVADRRDPATLADLRARHGLAERFVFYLGGFDARKDVVTLVRAFAAVRESLPGWQLVIAGRLRDDSPLFPDPRPVARELGLRVVEAPARDPAADVVFTGRVTEADKPLFYSAAGVFAFPSRYEGFGLDPLEALACGAPVVCSNATSLPEVVGDAALLVSPGDVQGLAEALIRVATDDALRADLSARGPAQATRFSWSRAAEETLAVYREAVTEHGARNTQHVKRQASNVKCE